MEEICRAYWYPLYAHARRIGFSTSDAEDLVQGFFMHIVEDGALATADPARGRLRTFFMAVVRNQAMDELRRRGAKKRGGDKLHVSLDPAWAENRLGVELEAVDQENPERAHDRRWALLILERVIAVLEGERSDANRSKEWRILSPFLNFSTGGKGSYESASEKLGWTVNATRVAVFRLRRRFRDLLTEAVADTLEEATPELIDAEIRELLVALE